MALAETPAERAARKAAKAARKAAKAAKAAAAGGEAAAPEKKRKREAAAADDAEPSAAAEERVEKAAKAARATPRLSNTEYRSTHEIKVRLASRAPQGRRAAPAAGWRGAEMRPRPRPPRLTRATHVAGGHRLSRRIPDV